MIKHDLQGFDIRYDHTRDTAPRFHSEHYGTLETEEIDSDVQWQFCRRLASSGTELGVCLGALIVSAVSLEYCACELTHTWCQPD